MLTEKKLLTAANNIEFTPLTGYVQVENMYATRDSNNQRIEIADLFTHFTASIINEDVPFTR